MATMDIDPRIAAAQSQEIITVRFASGRVRNFRVLTPWNGERMTIVGGWHQAIVFSAASLKGAVRVEQA